MAGESSHAPDSAEALRLARRIVDLASDKQASDIVLLDIRGVSLIADYFVIVSGTSEPHLRAISDEITEKLREEHNLRPRAVDGTLHGGWLVLDKAEVPETAMAVSFGATTTLDVTRALDRFRNT